jgi:UDP-2-acetamido-3-amino-2,3-dideoxy-glucuronate N-acetyltransferase
LVESAAIGQGTRIWAFAHVLKGARVGRHCNIGDHCFIEGGARIGNNVTVKNGVAVWEGVVVRDNAFIGPFAVFTNDLVPRSPRFPGAAMRYESKAWLSRTVLEEGASIGANATILCGLRIGRFAMIAAGAVVTRDVPPHALMVGVPARQAAWVCECGTRLATVERAVPCTAPQTTKTGKVRTPSDTHGARGTARPTTARVCSACGRRYEVRGKRLVPLC